MLKKFESISGEVLAAGPAGTDREQVLEMDSNQGTDGVPVVENRLVALLERHTTNAKVNLRGYH